VENRVDRVYVVTFHLQDGEQAPMVALFRAVPTIDQVAAAFAAVGGGHPVEVYAVGCVQAFGGSEKLATLFAALADSDGAWRSRSRILDGAVWGVQLLDLGS